MKKEKIIIIGAGSTGLSTALEIAKTGKAKVIVLEQSFVGSGQTGQCCGFVRNFYNEKEMTVSSHYSMKKIKDLCKKHKIFDYKKLGLLVLQSRKNTKEIKQNVELLKSQNIKARFLKSKSIRRINPYLEVNNSVAGYDKDAFYVNPQLIVDYLKKECEKYRVVIHENTKVRSISRKGSGFLLKTGRGEMGCDKLFNATAGYTNSINKMLDFELPVKSIRINNVFYRLPLGPNNYLTAVADFENCFYMIPHKNFIDVSSMTLDLKNQINPDKQKPKFDEATINKMLAIVAKRIKGAEKSATIGGFGSYIDVTADYYPIISAIDEIPNYYCASGFSGTGFKHFPMIGKIMSEIILGLTLSFPDLVKFFRYDRFKSNKLRRNVSDSYFIENN